MSEENVELVRNWLALWIEVDEGLVDRQRPNEFVTEDGVLTFSEGYLEDRSTLHGLDEFIEFRTAWMEPYDERSYEAEKILDAGDNGVVALFHQRGNLRDSDSWVEQDYGIIYTVEEGLISRGRIYAAPEEALEAAGLSE
jgi:ketosteroid isomerase-like protein